MGFTGPVRFGLAGAGVGGGFVARALKMLEEEDLVSLEVICDSVEGRAREYADRFGAHKHATDFGDLVRSGEIDAVAISTPHHLHYPMAVEAMDAGVNVLLDKPMAMNVKEADELIDMARRKGVSLGVVLQNRMSDDSRRAKAAIEADAFGRLVLGEATVKWFRDRDYYASSPWRGKKETEGGGVLINQAIHTLDLLIWLMGPVRRVVATTDTLYHTIEVEDVSVASLRFESGALGIIQASTVTYPGFPSRLEVHGTEGCALFETDRLRKLVVKGREEQVTPASQAAIGSWSRPEEVLPTNHYRVIRDFALSLREGRPPLIDGREGRRSLELIEAIYRSSSSAGWVELPL
jgi:predicted dehydrogenase